MDMLVVTFLAVSKVIVSVIIGVITTSSIPNSASTLRDFSFLISSVLLTSLTLSNTAQSVTLELLVRCSILILFSMLLIVWGLVWGVICSNLLFPRRVKYTGVPAELAKDVHLDLLFEEEESTPETQWSPSRSPTVANAPGSPNQPATPAGGKRKKKNMTPYVAVVLSEHLREVGVDGNDVVPSLEVPSQWAEDLEGYRWAMRLACSTQNGVTLPISLFANIADSVSFVDFGQGAAYIFVFAVSYMLYLWSAGPAFVEQGEKASKKRRLIRELITRHKRMTGRCDAMTQTLSLPVDYQLLQDVPGANRREGDPLSHAAASLDNDGDASHSNSSTGTAEGHDDDDTDSGSLTREVSSITNRSTTGAQTRTRFFGASDTRMATSAAAATLSGAPSAMSPTTAGEYAFTMATAEQFPYDWQAAGYIQVKYASEMKALKRTTITEKLQKLRSEAWGISKKLMVNLPFLAVVAGIVIGVISPLRGLFFDGGVLEMVMDAISLIGDGSIPSSLLLLGANLAGSAAGPAASAKDTTRMRHAEQNTEYPLKEADWRLLGEVDDNYAQWYETRQSPAEYDLHESFSLQTLRQMGQAPMAYVASPRDSNTAGGVVPMDEEEDGKPKESGFVANVRQTLSLSGISASFVWGSILLRLVVLPAFSFVALVTMIKTMPFLFGGNGTYDKTLITVLLIELAAPTAINTTLIFNARQFMTYPWAKMLFFQYILCTVTMVIWSAIGLKYVAGL